MKKLLTCIIILTLMAPALQARKAKKAGDVMEGTYTDGEYNFSLNVPDAWNSSVKKGKGHVRLVLTKKEYEIPVAFQHAPAYTTVPKVTVYADTTAMDVNVFVDSVMADAYKSDQKKEMLQEFKILYGDYKHKKRTRLTVDGVDGVIISGEQRYTIQVQRAGSESDKGDVVTDFYSGAVLFARKGTTIIMMHFICEKKYYDHLEQEFLGLVNGLKFLSPEGESEEEG